MDPTKSARAAEQTPIEDLSFEQSMGELEEIVALLEEEQLTLDKALSIYERGQALARHCADLLDRAELRVQQLSGDDLVDIDPDPQDGE